jgi:xanthine dehydrogenase accessory factor
MNEFQFALENLKAGQPVVLATIIRQVGSSPRGKSARMAVNVSGQFAGTIGGGKLEEIVKRSFDSLIAGNQTRVIEFTLSETEAESLEMICGGSVSILVEPILPQEEALIATIQKIADFAAGQKYGWLISQVPAPEQKIDVRHVVITADGVSHGNISPAYKIESGLLKSLTLGDSPSEEFYFENGLRTGQELEAGGQIYFVEPIGKLITCFIVGAGHIAQKLAPLCKLVGFRTVVLDDRPEYLSEQRFPTVDQRILLDNFPDFHGHIQIDTDSFLVIVTRSHQTDKNALGLALNTPAAYIGMIGSRRKIALIFESLKAEGIRQEALDKVHAPIGLAIAAETPEEIAVSIIAEMIQERAKLKK